MPSFRFGPIERPRACLGAQCSLYVTNADGAGDNSANRNFFGTSLPPVAGLTNPRPSHRLGADATPMSRYFNSEVLRYNGTSGAFLTFSQGSAV